MSHIPPRRTRPARVARLLRISASHAICELVQNDADGEIVAEELWSAERVSEGRLAITACDLATGEYINPRTSKRLRRATTVLGKALHQPAPRPIASKREIEASRARRWSVCELQRRLHMGTRLLIAAADGPAHLARTAESFGLSTRAAAACIELCLAEERGCLAAAVPMTLDEAQIAAGI